MTKAWIGQSNSTLFACEEPGCYYRIALRFEGDGIAHKCPRRGPTTLGWSYAVNLIAKMWTMLDDTMEVIMSEDSSPEAKSTAKIRASAQAEMILVFMRPYFETVQDISREAKKRYDAHKSGDSVYITSGLGDIHILPPDAKWLPAKGGGYTSNPTMAATAGGRVANETPAVSLTEAERNNIKQAIETGMFTDGELAKVYGISVDTIRSLLI